MSSNPWTCLFYIVVAILAAGPLLFVWSIWHQAQKHGWFWTNEKSRSMYVDATKTVITAAGVAVALLASSATKVTVNPAGSIVAFSARVAVVCLVFCVALSVVVIVALVRNFDNAQSRYMDELRKTAQRVEAGQGKLSKGELLFTLLFAGPALSCFLVGFAFLGRIAFHF